MTSNEHLHFIQFIEERRSQASSAATKSAYTIVKDQYMKIHSKNLKVVDMDFKAIKDILMDNGDVVKAGKVFKCYSGLVSGVGSGYLFSNKEYFEPVNINYEIVDQ
jgi:hypothetical protein